MIGVVLMNKLNGVKGQAAIGFAAANARSLKGQAAMEYLMTYGWALLVIVIVIGILLWMNPFSAPQGCRFDQIGFTCENPVIDSNGALYMMVTNNNNNAINLVGIACVQDRSNNLPTSYTKLANAQFINRQGSFDTSNESIRLECTKFDGTALSALQPGSDFSGKVWLFYRNEEDGTNYPIRSTGATIVTKVVAAGAQASAAPVTTTDTGTAPRS